MELGRERVGEIHVGWLRDAVLVLVLVSVSGLDWGLDLGLGELGHPGGREGGVRTLR